MFADPIIWLRGLVVALQEVTGGTMYRISAVGFVAFVATGCNLPFASSRSVILPIVSIEAPATVAAGSSFSVTAVAQFGGCKSLRRITATRSGNTLTFVAHGTDSSGPGISCPADIRNESRVELVTPPFFDPFRIHGRQPDGSDTTVEVRVL